MLYLDRRETASSVDRDALRAAVADAMCELSAGRATMPDRVGVMTDDPWGILAVMPAHVPAIDALATKIVTVFPDNADGELPTHQGIVVLVDPATGAMLALLDGGVITAERTAAGSALSTELLARRDADVLTVIGTGVQAESHLLNVSRVREFSEIRIAGRSTDRATALAAQVAGELAVTPTVDVDVESAVAGADVVCLTTDASAPVIDRSWLSPGTHVTSVGFNAEGPELDAATVVASKLVVESRAAALAPYPVGSHDLGGPLRDGLITPDHVHAEIGELVDGRIEGRTDEDELTLYKSSGVAVQDAAAARLLYDTALARGVGTDLPA